MTEIRTTRSLQEGIGASYDRAVTVLRQLALGQVAAHVATTCRVIAPKEDFEWDALNRAALTSPASIARYAPMMLMLLLAASVSQPKLIPAFGFGSVKCEEAFKQEAATQSESWILGFWTGLNIQSAAGVGAGKSNADVLGSVKANCAKQPSTTLLSATQLAYRTMKGR